MQFYDAYLEEKDNADSLISPEELADALEQLAELQPDDIFRRLYLQQYGEEAHADHLSAFAELMLALPDEAGKR